MEVTFVNAKENSDLNAIAVEPNSAVIGLNLTNAGTLTKDGFPQFRFYPTLKVVTLGVQRMHKPEERASLMSMAGQALSFVSHHPQWKPAVLVRPIFDITGDDSLTAVLLEPETRDGVIAAGTKLSALIAELAEWGADRYNFVKQQRPRLLHNFLNEFPFPFKDIPGKTRAESCWKYLAEQEDFWHTNIANMEAVERVFPQVRCDVIFNNERSVLLLVESDRYGKDDLAAQMFFQANPGIDRIVLVRRLPNSVKHTVMVVNASLYDETLTPYQYPNIKELNGQERKTGGDPGWKNLKVQTIGPQKGTGLSFETIWASTKIE